jgi:hypothetical protein
MEWYELTEEERIKQVYTKYSIADFFNWWSSSSPQWMEVRIKDYEIIKEMSEKLGLPYSPSGLFVNNSNDLKRIINEIRLREKKGQNITCWYGVNPRKLNYNKFGKKTLGGLLVNVQSINFLFIDIDRLVKLAPATSIELSNADKFATEILNVLGREGWNKNYCKICSGNGVQLLCKLDYPMRMPNVLFNKEKSEYTSNDEFDNYVSMLRNKIGKQLLRFSMSGKFTELGVTVDKASFNLAGVCALPVTKNYKYDGYTWRGIIELKAEGENVGLTDYIAGGLTPTEGKANVFSKSKLPRFEDKLIAGKLRDNSLIRLMLDNDLPFGAINNKPWFQLKCLIRDSQINIKSEEFKAIHSELEHKYKGAFTLNIPDKKYRFNRNIINSYCFDNLIPPIYEVYEDRIAKTGVNIDKIDIKYMNSWLVEPLKLNENASIYEDMDMLSTKFIYKNDMLNQELYQSFLKGFLEKYGKEKTEYYSRYVFIRYFCWG